ncbi:MAG: hypothetical protein IJW09_00170 [Clostridia bacterium]|nr:hypothetical protein [Clostridia bacterium]
MMSENKQYVAPISEEAIAAMRRKSAASLPDDPSAAGMKANEIRKKFWSPVLGDTHSLFAELDRVIGEINAALGNQTGISDEQAAAIAELDNLLIELTKKAAELQAQTETLGADAAELEQKTQELAAAAEALEERIGKVEDAETIDHRDMTHRDAAGAHPMSAIEGLVDAIADLEGAISSAVSGHNTDAAAHGDIRLLIKGVSDRLNAIANSDDVTLDDFKEIVAYIKANKELIDSITASKVSVSDIVNDLATNAADKPLSAAQGVVLKGLIDESSALPTVSEGDEGKMLQVVDGAWQAAEAPKGADVTVDTELSETSENPVQNKVITQVVQEAGAAMEELGMAIQYMAQRLAPAASINMSAFDSEGKIVETFADGTSKTTVIEFDAGGNPVKITDGDGNVTVLTW